LPEIAAEQLVPEQVVCSVRAGIVRTVYCITVQITTRQATFIQLSWAGRLAGPVLYGFRLLWKIWKENVQAVLQNSKRIRITDLNQYFSHELFLLKFHG
jgi:hypothetical protein